MVTRRQYIEMVRRQIYGGQPSNDAGITVSLVNKWLDIAIGAAAKQNYKENLALEGVSYINNSFYSTFKSIAATKDEQFLWKVTLPQIPLGLGATEGVSSCVFKDAATGQISYPVVLISENQKSFQKGRREIPNKLIGYAEGKYIYVMSTIQLSQYTATVTMVSGGTSTDLDSTLTIPDDYMPMVVEYLKQQLMFALSVPADQANDGRDVNPDA